jgi:branched-chain amino acid transport system substrate-binding protein
MEKTMQYAITGVVMVLIVAGVAFVAFQNTQDDNDDIIRIGAAVSKTGKYTVEGERVKNGYEMAVSEINAAGGVNVNGKMFNISLITYDDQSDTAIAQSAYEDLMYKDNCHILMGPYSSGLVKTAAPLAEAEHIPFVQAGGAADDIYTQGYEYVFGLYRVGSTYTQPFFQWLNESGNIDDVNSITVFHEGDSFSASVWDGAQKFIASAGLTLTEFGYASGEYDSIGSNMLTVNDADADIILTIGHYADVTRVVNEIEVNNLTPKAVYGTVGIAEPKFVSEVGTIANNSMGFAQWVTNLDESGAPGITAFLQNYENKYGEEPAYHAAGGYSAVYVVKAAIEAAKTFTNGDKVRDALRALDIDLAWGHVKFESNGVIAGPAFMVQIQNDEIETVYPIAAASASIVYPK